MRHTKPKLFVEQESAFDVYRNKLRSSTRKPLSTLKRVTKKLKKKPPPPKLPENECKKYTIKKPFPQSFSLPENIIYYIARNQINLKCQQNLMKCCKLLCRMSNILPVKEIVKGSRYKNDISWIANNEILLFLKNQTYKLWIYDKLKISNIKNNNYWASQLIPRIYKCTLQELDITKQNLTFRELQILVDGEKLQKIKFNFNVIKEDDGSVTEFEKVFKVIICKRMFIKFQREFIGYSEKSKNEIQEFLLDEIPPHLYALMKKDIQNYCSFESISQNIVEYQNTLLIRFHSVTIGCEIYVEQMNR